MTIRLLFSKKKNIVFIFLSLRSCQYLCDDYIPKEKTTTTKDDFNIKLLQKLRYIFT